MKLNILVLLGVAALAPSALALDLVVKHAADRDGKAQDERRDDESEVLGRSDQYSDADLARIGLGADPKPEIQDQMAENIKAAAAKAFAHEATADETPPVLVPVDIQPTFSSLKKNIFVTRCSGCHHGGPTHPVRGMPVFDMSDFTSVSSLVTPGDAENSILYEAVEPGGRMPLRGPKLSAAEVAAIGDWIKNGAKNDEAP